MSEGDDERTGNARGMTRRALLAAGVITGVSTLFGLGNHKGASSVQTPGRITSKEYLGTLERIKELGLPIDEQHTFYSHTSSHLVVFLPDIHTRQYQAKQRKRISSLDAVLDFDAVGLEGVVGIPDAAQISCALQQTKEHQSRFAVPQLAIDPGFDTYDFTIKESDPEVVKLQKNCVHLNRALNALVKSAEVQVGLKEKSKGYESLLDLQMQLGRLATHQRVQCSINQWLESDSYLETYIKSLDSSGQSAISPGLPYLIVATRAPKIGIENELYTLSDHYFRAMQLDEGIHTIAQQREWVREANIRFAQAYPALSVSLGKRLEDYLGSWNNVLAGMQSTKDARIQQLPERYQLFFINGGIKQGFDELVCDKRSASWIANVQPYRKTLLIGGAAHSPSVVSSAKEKDYSIITLKKIELY